MAAIASLAGLEDPAAAAVLLELLSAGGPDRQRASAAALGDLHHVDAVPALVEALDNKDDRVTADVAWALGEIASASSDARKAVVSQALPALARAGKSKNGGWATAINVTAALARIADVSSQEDLTRMLAVVNAIEQIAKLETYRDVVLNEAPAIARQAFGPHGAFMGYDFHITSPWAYFGVAG